MCAMHLSFGLASVLALACSAGDVHSLDTERTSLVFETGDSPEGTRLYLRHYGARLADAASARATAWRNESVSEVGYETPTAYTAFGDATGSRNTFNGYNPYGGLAVVHADGCLTSDLVVEGIDRKGDTLTVRWRDAQYPFRATQVFRVRKDADVIETCVALENGETGPVRLVRMASLTLALPLVSDRFRLQTTPGQWTSENQLAESEVARGQTVSIGSRSGVRGAWGSNPSFMVTVGDASTETSGRVIGVALCWSGVWEASVRRSHTDFLEIDAGAQNCAGPYVLESGRRITLPTAVLTYSEAGKGRVSRNFHRWARRYRMPHGTSVRDVVLNSFYGTGFAFGEQSLLKLMDGAKALGVETFVLDDGWFGNGRFARDDDRRGLGDWTVNAAKLPQGLGFLCDEARKRGMKFGLWVEPEMANTNSEFYTSHPDWVLRERGRPFRMGRGDSQVVVDLANPAARDEVWRRISAAYASVPGLAYVKWDANADFMNPGSPWLAPDRQANVFFDYAAGYVDLLERQRAKYPDLVVQACASGGGHTDYASLGFGDEFWASDTIDPRERVMIQWGASQFYPAGAMACHIAVDPFRKVPFKFRADVACSGRLGVEMLPEKLTDEERKFLVKVISDYKRIRPVVQLGDLHRLVSPCDHDHAALMYVAEDRRRAVVFVYGLSRQQRRDFPPPLMLRGLAPDVRYVLRELNVFGNSPPHARLADGRSAVRGDALMASGLPFTLAPTDYDSAVFELTACADEEKASPCPKGVSFGYEGKDRMLRIENRYGRLSVSLRGAQIRSYAPSGVGEVLYRPRRMEFDGTTENRGGIPLCWPWFGRNGEPGSAPHGFARFSDFSVREFIDEGDRTGVVLSLVPTEETRRLFPYDCALDYRIVLGETLELELKTSNRGTNEVLITEGLHPYWRVEDRRRTSVSGLDGAPCCFADLTTVSNAVWKGNFVPDVHYDHVFWCGGKPLRITDEVSGRTVDVSGSGYSKYVIWTPDPFRDGDFENLPPADRMNFVCVEPATLFRVDGYRLAPGKSHALSVSIRARSRSPSLDAGFRAPPKDASPHVWYHLMNGHVTKAGITRDFEELAAAGLGGVQMFDAGCGIEAGPLAFASSEWFDMMAHAFREAERLGLDVAVANCSGWSTAGGPWIAPSNSMKKLVFTKGEVLEGGTRFDGTLAVPKDTHGFYEDIAALAVPEPSARILPPPVRTTKDGDGLVLEFDREVTARGFSYRVDPGFPWALDGEIAAEPGGRHPVTFGRSGVTDGTFRYRAFQKPETARRFRFSLKTAEPTTAHNPPDTDVRLTDVRLEGDVKIDELAAKTFAYRMDAAPTPAETDRPVPVASVIDLTDRMSADGKLDWSVPPGRWRILRFGFASNGKKCHPASKTGEGLEVDKLDPDAVALHFRAYAGRLASFGSPAFKGILVDSYEAGAQNWTRGLERLFQERRGYDLRPWLPVFAGYVVDSVAASERVLADFRRVVSDRFAAAFAGTLQCLCHETGIRLNLEPYGNAGARNLDYGAFADVPMSEFWLHDDRRFENGGNGRIAASLAHVHGRPVAAAEAFTSAPEKTHGRWLDTPWRMKSAGDRSYAAGVNRLVYHRFTHQPDESLPGMTMGMFGVHFDRKQTWWKGFAKSFVDYQRRCQWMLQAGEPRVDVLFVDGEDAPDEGGSTHGGARDAYPLPDGYSGDVATASVVRNLLKGDDGVWFAPGGARYLAVVPSGSAATELLAKRGIPPDVLAPAGTYWTHRGDAARDWYFVMRESETAEVVRCSFRVQGRTPEIWDAETGEIRRALDWCGTNGRTEVAVRLRPRGSAFVVFGPRRVDVRLEEPLWQTSRIAPVLGTWQLSFPKIGSVTLSGLQGWTTLSDSRMRHFSGTADYEKNLTVTPPQAGERLVLELGRVCDLAEVSVNGGPSVALWRPPHEVDVTESARSGRLALRVRVTNLWPNRLIGDDALAPSERVTKTSWKHWNKSDALLPSGLLGPVRVRRQIVRH